MLILQHLSACPQPQAPFPARRRATALSFSPLRHAGPRCVSMHASETACSANGAPQLAQDSVFHGGVAGFSKPDAERFSIAVVGDLHLEPDQMPQFRSAREQLRLAITEDGGEGAAVSRVVQLGDLGGYEHQPGARHEHAGGCLGGRGYSAQSSPHLSQVSVCSRELSREGAAAARMTQLGYLWGYEHQPGVLLLRAGGLRGNCKQVMWAPAKQSPGARAVERGCSGLGLSIKCQGVCHWVSTGFWG